ncbi:MAG: protoporphyrinogen oxidase HemJ [Gammaproteobacteria bacterium]|nr:MAG: protoporphyrinogen oxidase HemJ [Gammaproteobacteria bacterium]
MLWLKAFHLIFVVCWFAALFYLPRLFVYHAMSEDAPSRERFKIMERKLYRGIAWPSLVLTWGFGLAMVFQNPEYYAKAGWFHTKLLLVVLLVAYHLLCGHYLKAFRDDRNRHSHVFYRWFNEFPVLVLFGAVILAVVKPY